MYPTLYFEILENIKNIDISNIKKINKLNNNNFKYNNTFTEIQPYVKSNKNNFFNRFVILNKLYNFYDENLSCQQ